MMNGTPHVEIEIPEQAFTPFVLRRAQEWGDRPALVDGQTGRIVSYAQLYQRIRHTAKSLVQRGYRKGDVFAFYSPNLPDYVIAVHAIATMGGIVTTVSPSRSGEMLAGHLQASGAKALLTTAQLLPQAQEAAGQSCVQEIFTFDQADGAIPFNELFESILAVNEAPTNALLEPGHDLVALSAGNSASDAFALTPHTHADYVRNLCHLSVTDDLVPGDVFLLAVPVYRSYGMMLLNHALQHGATVVVVRQFELAPFLTTAQQYRATRAPLSDVMLVALARQSTLERFALASFRVFYVQAGQSDDDTRHRCQQHLHVAFKCVNEQHSYALAGCDSDYELSVSTVSCA